MNRDIRIAEIMSEQNCESDAAEQMFIDEIMEKYGVNDTEVAETLYELEEETNDETEKRIRSLYESYMEVVGADNCKLVIEHGKLTMEAVQRISSFISELPLSTEDNNSLIKLMVIMLLAAEREQYLTGFEVALNIINDLE